ncbi:MAG: 16S rRNA (cytidine(1402)-2'-O)-methyltransferase [Clostridiales bacterium]|nr:16S rRNA (cytidine(1402)-2'-O)-methyltransferase [Clostridiales bacterium]
MLYLTATPIGNLGDLTARARDAFAACDCVYCEDTRVTGGLLHHLGLKKPLFSCHAHNENSRVEEVIDKLRAGQSVVYASDAGMPGVSDPGALLAATCVDAGLEFTVLPGASAVLTAAVLSALPCQPFSFYGFLPRKGAARRAVLEELGTLRHLVILYESPNRLQATLIDLQTALGDYRAAVLRELTKLHETAYRGHLSELIPLFPEPPKGECVICVLPEGKQKGNAPDLDAVLCELLKAHSVKDAAAQAATLCGIAKKTAYQRALELRDG